jgi:hypothetical protein
VKTLLVYVADDGHAIVKKAAGMLEMTLADAVPLFMIKGAQMCINEIEKKQRNKGE